MNEIEELEKGINVYDLDSSILYMIFIFILSSIPVDEEDKLGGLIYIKPTTQNLLHIPLFGLLAFLWMRVFNDKQLVLKKAIVCTLIITIFYSLFDEFHQYFIPGRYASLGDFLFNIAGCLGGVVVYRFVIKQIGRVNKEALNVS